MQSKYGLPRKQLISTKQSKHDPHPYSCVAVAVRPAFGMPLSSPNERGRSRECHIAMAMRIQYPSNHFPAYRSLDHPFQRIVLRRDATSQSHLSAEATPSRTVLPPGDNIMSGNLRSVSQKPPQGPISVRSGESASILRWLRQNPTNSLFRPSLRPSAFCLLN